MNQPLAYIHPEAKIGENTVIEPFAMIHKNVEIGKGSWIGSHTTLMEGSRVGDNCKVFPGAVIASVPQDLKFKGEASLVHIGDNSTIREFATINRGTIDKYQTSIGENCLVMAYVHIAHDCYIGDNCILVNGAQLAGHIEVGDWAFVGGTSAIHQFVKIGTHSFVSGGSLVRKDVPPYIKAAREPMTYCGVNSVGLRRRGFSNEQINEIQEIYRTIYLKGYNNSESLDKVEMECKPSAERDLILNFIRSSERGIIRGSNSHD